MNRAPASTPPCSLTVLVPLGRRHRKAPKRRLTGHRNVFLTVLAARSPRSRCQQTGVRGEPAIRRWPPSRRVLTWQKGQGSPPGSLLQEPWQEVSTRGTQAPPRGPATEYHHVGHEVQHMNLGTHTHLAAVTLLCLLSRGRWGLLPQPLKSWLGWCLVLTNITWQK